MNWKPFLHQAFVPPVYTSMEVSDDGRIFIGRYRSSTKCNLVAGYVDDLDQNMLNIPCGPILSSYEDLLMKIKTILAAIPVSKDPFLYIPRKASISPYTMDSKFMKKINSLLEEAKTMTKHAEQTEKMRTPHKSDHRKNGQKMPTLPLHINEPSQNLYFSQQEAEEEQIIHFEPPAPAVIAEDDGDQPEAIQKTLPMTQDEFLTMLAGMDVQVKKPKMDYDLRMTITKPKPGVKITSLQYRLDFGKYFLEKKPDFKEVLAGKGIINGKEEELLMFNNEYFKDSNIPIATKKDGQFVKTSTSSALIQMICNDLNISISQISGATTIIRFDVIPVTVKSLEDCNFILSNMRREVLAPSSNSTNNQ